MRSYAQTFVGWQFVDLDYPRAVELVTRLLKEGAGFGCTTESNVGRRIYVISETSTRIVKEYLDELPEGPQ